MYITKSLKQIKEKLSYDDKLHIIESIYITCASLSVITVSIQT